jgi:DNA-binding Xre family transcriptional regulator
MKRKKEIPINTEETAQRLRGAYDYLIHNRIDEVVSQKDIAEKIGRAESNVSQAVTGKERYLTYSFIRRFCTTFPMISQEWLLTGEGKMLDGTDPGKKDKILFRFADPIDEMMLKEPEPEYQGRTISECLQRIIELSEEVGRLKAENEALKKERAQTDEGAGCAIADNTG